MTALTPRVQPLFEKTKPVCFGRFMADVPITATVVYGPAWAPSDIARFPGEGEKLDARVKERLAAIESEKDGVSFTAKKTLLGSDSMYGKSIDGTVPDQKIVFGQSDGIFYKIESFVKVGADLYVQRTTASPKDGAEERATRWTVSQRVADLNTVAHNLRPRADDKVPTDPGLCIDGAFIADNPAVTHERVTIGVRLKEFPDVHFSIEVNKNQGRVVESNALKPRIKQNRDRANAQGLGLWYARIQELRSADRQVAQWKGYEHLAYMPGREDQGAQHDFAFMAVGAPSDPLEPMLDVRMSTGVSENASGKVPPSLTDEEAVAVWDKLTSTIRVRPTNGGTKTSDATPPKAPLGELVATGRACPQPGWWECAEEARPVQGGRRQFFRGGERMPHAMLQGEPSVWQKLKGETPTHRVATVWKLVDYDTSPESLVAPAKVIQSSGTAAPASDSAPEKPNEDV